MLKHFSLLKIPIFLYSSPYSSYIFIIILKCNFKGLSQDFKIRHFYETFILFRWYASVTKMLVLSAYLENAYLSPKLLIFWPKFLNVGQAILTLCYLHHSISDFIWPKSNPWYFLQKNLSSITIPHPRKCWHYTLITQNIFFFLLSQWKYLACRLYS